jgi:hypothetical protein
MSRKLDFKVGQKVAVKIITGSNASRHINMSLNNIDEWCFDGEVTKVGRKYITAKFNKWQEYQFDIDNDYTNKYTASGSDYQLYLSKEKIIEEKEANDLYRDIQTQFSGYSGNNSKFTLDQLKRIMSIIKENEE